MDFSGFQASGASVCTCRLFVQTGTRLYFNHLSSPGYVGCGTEVYISHRGTSIIRCLPAGDIVTVQPGDIVNIKITRDGYSTNVDSNYCYIVNTGMAFSLNVIVRYKWWPLIRHAYHMTQSKSFLIQSCSKLVYTIHSLELFVNVAANKLNMWSVNLWVFFSVTSWDYQYQYARWYFDRAVWQSWAPYVTSNHDNAENQHVAPNNDQPNANNVTAYK